MNVICFRKKKNRNLGDGFFTENGLVGYGVTFKCGKSRNWTMKWRLKETANQRIQLNLNTSCNIGWINWKEKRYSLWNWRKSRNKGSQCFGWCYSREFCWSAIIFHLLHIISQIFQFQGQVLHSHWWLYVTTYRIDQNCKINELAAINENNKGF